MREMKHWIYLSLALGMLIYAVPRLEIGQGATLPTVFGVVWICFALAAIAANLHRILGVDEETRRALDRVKKMRRWQTGQMLAGKRRMFK